jgi:GNAT superfamily N-acetyltransferase
METIQLALSEEAVMKCFTALKELRSNLEKNNFLDEIRKLQIEQGYNLAYIEKNEEAVSVIGFHIRENLALGKYLHINDLSTIKAYKNKGFASELTSWALEYAQTKKCNQIFIDLYENPEAESLCKKKGFEIVSQKYAVSY